MNNDNFLTCPVYSNRFKEQEAECIKYPYDKKDKNVPNDIYFCGNCGVGIAYPPLSKKQLEELYFNGEYWDDSKIQLITPNSFPGQYVLSKSRWDFFKNGIKNNIKKSWSILDVGAGHGFYGMIAADDKDIDVVEYCAIEADKALKESLAKTWNKNNFKTKLEIYDSTEKIDKKYDLIVLSHILEHVLDPKSFLENVSTYLNDGGTLLLGVPNKDYLFKADVFPHLFFFSKKSIEILMESIELNVKSICFYGKDAQKAKKDNIFAYCVEVFFYKARRIIPKAFLIKFYAWRLKAFYENNNGTWMRALAEKR